jgi:hypothetical protein
LARLAVESVRGRPTADEVEAWRSPPYPTPACHAPFEDAATAALRQRLDRGGSDPMCTCRLYDAAQPFTERARVALRRCPPEAGFRVLDTVCLLLAGGLIAVPAAQTIRGSLTGDSAAFLHRAIVYRHLGDGDTDRACQAADDPVMEQRNWVTWRAVGEHHASAADAAHFLAIWPKYNARKERDWIDRMRRTLVLAVSRARGWREAVALTGDKRVGADHRADALAPIAATGDAAGLSRLLATEPELAALGELTKLRLLIDAMLADRATAADAATAAEDDHPELAGVLARLIAVDPTESKEQMRTRDWLLVSCWPVIGRAETLATVRAAVRTPNLRRELAHLRAS